jgi:creatinine amidohydrolase
VYSRHPRRFYIVNTGVSTVRALQPAASTLASEGVLRYTDLNARLEPATKGYTEQPGGTHADEVETSMMLYIDPAAVDISKAVKDFTPSSGGTDHKSRRPPLIRRFGREP